MRIFGGEVDSSTVLELRGVFFSAEEQAASSGSTASADEIRKTTIECLDVVASATRQIFGRVDSDGFFATGADLFPELFQTEEEPEEEPEAEPEIKPSRKKM